jgi:hypothetical protein
MLWMSFNGVMDTGEVWAYREHPRSLGEPVHRVEIVKVGQRGGMIRVRRLDGEDAGLQEWAHPSSLLCRWDEADRRLGDEQRMLAVREASVVAQGTAEYEAAVFVVGHCGLGRRVALGRSKAELGVMRISKATVVGNELGLDAGELAREHPAAFTDSHGILVAPWPMAMAVARQAASAYAGVILPELEREERESRSQALYGWENPGYLRARGTGRERPKPDRTRVHEMVREWCGAEPVERFDEVLALRAEVVRLGGLIERAVTALRQRGASATAATIERDLGVPISTLMDAGRHR